MLNGFLGFLIASFLTQGVSKITQVQQQTLAKRPKFRVICPGILIA